VRALWPVLYTAILFAAFAVRLWNLGTQSLWHDEAWSVMSAYTPLTPIDPNYPPFFTVLLGVWIRLVGDSVWAMRYWSLLFGVATVAVVIMVVRRWFGERAALIAALLTAVSPPLWVFSQEIRSYVLVPLLTTLLLGLAGEVINLRGPDMAGPYSTKSWRGARRVLIWLALTEIILLYTHNLAVPVVAWLNVTIIAIWFIRRDWRRLLTWLLVQAGLLILYLPWLLTQRPTGTPLNTPPQINPTLIWDIWQSYFTGIKALVGADTILMGMTAIAGIFAVAALIAMLIYRKSVFTLLVLSQALLIPIFEVIIILAAHIDFHPRYFLAGVPALLILIAVGMDTLAQELKFRTVPLVRSVPAAFAAILAVIIMARMVMVVYSSPIYQHDDFRAIAQRFAQLGSDAAIIIPYGYEPTLEYYRRKMDFRARMVGIPLHADSETIIKRLTMDIWDRAAPRAELLTWYQLPADVRGAYPCLLGATGAFSDSMTVSGLKTDTYTELMPPTLKESSSNVDFREVRLLRSRQIGRTGDKTCVITDWQMQIPSHEDWRVTVRAQNPRKWRIGQADSDMLSSRQLPTSFWQEGQVESAFNLLKLPDGAPANVYFHVVAGVYSASTEYPLSYYLDGKPAGFETFLGTVHKWFPYREPVHLTSTDVDLGNGLYLHRKEIPLGPLQPALQIRATLEFWQTGSVLREQPVMLKLEGQDWMVSSRLTFPASTKMLGWYELEIPSTAGGKAALKLEFQDRAPLVIAEYIITPRDRVFTEPVINLASRIETDFPGVGVLIGASELEMKKSDMPSITLLWKASDTPTTDFVVFVQLLDPNHRVIAQSDRDPAEGNRPTSGWVNGEYIVDNHKLTWNRSEYSGPATIVVGLYDRNTGERVKLKDGSDHIVLPMKINVTGNG
jgi:hypothetical protein